MRPYYEERGIVIYCDDCQTVLPQIETASIDIAVTSPPYNMGLVPGGNGRGMYRPGAGVKAGRFRDGYGTHLDAMPQADYDVWQRAVIAELWRIVSGAVFYNHRPRVEHGRLRLPLGLDFGPAVLRQIIIWDRGTGIDVTRRHFCTRQEWICLLAKPELQLIDYSASGMGDVWSIGMEYHETGHPSPFPVTLPHRCLVATDAQSVIDPFMGSGSTLVAAQRLGRRAIGIDIEEHYCEIAAQRLRQGALHFDLTPEAGIA